MNTFSNNTLLDNSENYRMVDCLKTMLLNEQCAELKIASGYWDLPGMKVIYPELKSFLERGGRLDLLIGEEPPVRQYQKYLKTRNSLPTIDKEQSKVLYKLTIRMIFSRLRPPKMLLSNT